jgi:hypothetical protein
MWYVWKKREYTQGLVGEPEGNVSLGRRMIRREDYIKLSLKETELDGLKWIILSSGRNKYEHVMKPRLS